VGFGAYAAFMGTWLLVAPGPMLDFLRTARTQEHWIRLLGASAIVLGFYYIVAGRADLVVMMRASLWGRLGMAAAFGALVILGIAPVLLLGIAGNELLGVLWTTLALRADERAGRHAPVAGPAR
jgi:predicted amidohydrolase